MLSIYRCSVTPVSSSHRQTAARCICRSSSRSGSASRSATGRPASRSRRSASSPIDLGVSVITVKRAYLELEREGVIVTQHGKGSVVADGADVGARIHEQDFAKHLEQVVRLGALLGLTPKEIQARLREATERLTAAAKERT